jgi:quercetin 2,3-dioxygenase
VIAGTTDAGTTGPVSNQHVNPTYMDVSLPANGVFEQSVARDANAFLYVIDGDVRVGGQGMPLQARHLGVLSEGDQVVVSSADSSARFLLIAGQPINESVARGGPFVMNTKEEIIQAYSDFRNNQF